MIKNKTMKVSVIIVILLLVGILVYTLAGNKNVIKVKDDFDIMANALIKMKNAKSYNLVSKINQQILKSDKEEKRLDIIKKYIESKNMNYNVSKTKDNKVSIKLDTLSKINIFDMDIYADEEMVIVNAPNIYEKKVYIKYNDLDTFLSNFGVIEKEDIDVREYYHLLDIKNRSDIRKIKWLKYYEIMKKYYTDRFVVTKDKEIILDKDNSNSKVICDEYKMTVKLVDMYRMIDDLLQLATNDEEIKIAYKHYINDLYNVVQRTNDYKAFGLTEDEFKDYIKEFEENFEDHYSTAINNIETNIKDIIDKIDNSTSREKEFLDIDTVYTIYIDKKGNVVKMESEQIFGGDELKIKTVDEIEISNVNETIIVKKPDITDAKDISTLTKQQIQSILLGLYMKNLSNNNLQENITDNTNNQDVKNINE